MRIEAVLLTGGASRRMGQDKAALLVDGEPLGHRTARVLAEAGYPVTVLGAEPLEGHGFQRDASPHEGPLAVLRTFSPSMEAVFVAACDMPLFDPRVVAMLAERLAGADAVVPVSEGRLQPLCALYRAEALRSLARPELAEAQSVMRFLESLVVVELNESELRQAGIAPRALRGANTLEELAVLLAPEQGPLRSGDDVPYPPSPNDP